MTRMSSVKTASDQNGYAEIDISAATALNIATGDAEPPAGLTALPDRERRDELDRAEDQDDPSPGVEAAEDERGVVDEEARVADGRDPPDDVKQADERDHDPGEEHPSGARAACADRVGRPGPGDRVRS